MKLKAFSLKLLAACTTLFIAFSVVLVTVKAYSDEIWFAYLYNDISSTVIRVNSDGSSERFSLEMATYLDKSALSISPDGSLIATCDAYDPSQSTTTLYIRDIVQESNLLTLSFEPADFCVVGTFNAEGNELSLGLGYGHAGDGNTSSWRLLILDVATGAIIDEFNGNMPQAPDLLAPIYQATPYYFNPTTPVLVQGLALNADEVVFKAIPIIPDGTFSQPAFIWNRQDDSVREWHEAGHYGGDFLLETNEIVFLDYDETLPRGVPFGMMESSNVVKIRDANGTRTIYHDAEWLMMDAKFVNQGEQIVVTMLLASSPDGRNYLRYELINRDGSHHSITHLDATGQTSNQWLEGFTMRPIGDGMLVHRQNSFEAQFLGADLLISLDFYDGENLVNIWQESSAAGAEPHYYPLLWTSPVQLNPVLVAFSAINQ